MRSGCYMIQSFSQCRRLCRFFGCFFIQNLTERSFHRARATWKNPYTLYALAWVSMVVVVEGYGAIGRLVMVVRKGVNRYFAVTMASVLHITVIVQVMLNFSCSLFGTRRMLDFFRMSAQYEKSAAFCPPTRRTSWKSGWLVRLMRVVILAGALGKYGFLVTFQHALSKQVGTGAATTIVLSISTAGYVFYDCITYLVLRSTCGVLVRYMRGQRQALDELRLAVIHEMPLKKTSSALFWACLRVESIRLNVSKIKELKNSLENVWSPALFYSAPCLLWLKCATVNGFFHNQWQSNEFLYMISCYAVHSSLRFWELALVSQSFYDEAHKLRESVRATSTYHGTDLYFKQVKFLHDSIVPKEWCLSGGGFFRMDQSLIVTMMAALITYTVILVQTGDELANRGGGFNTTYGGP